MENVRKGIQCEWRRYSPYSRVMDNSSSSFSQELSHVRQTGLTQSLHAPLSLCSQFIYTAVARETTTTFPGPSSFYTLFAIGCQPCFEEGHICSGPMKTLGWLGTVFFIIQGPDDVFANMCFQNEYVMEVGAERRNACDSEEPNQREIAAVQARLWRSVWTLINALTPTPNAPPPNAPSHTEHPRLGGMFSGQKQTRTGVQCLWSTMTSSLIHIWNR